MRYTKTRLIDKKGVTSRTSPIYPEIPERDSDIYVITQIGDRLDTLAFDFYKNPHMWWVIAKANNLKQMNIPNGTSLRIPQLTEDIKVV
tara:strand:+ start:450 stop:716 length:267 start_codon:yes stop_codon:yes gene_type:complete